MAGQPPADGVWRSGQQLARTMFEDVELVFSALEAEDLDSLRTDTMYAGYERLDRFARAVESLKARWLAAIARRGEQDPADSRHDTLREWVSAHCQVSSDTAYAQIMTARQLSEMPVTTAALRQGFISAQAASIICRCVRQAGGSDSIDPAEAERSLVDLAPSVEPRDLHRAWQQYRYERDQAAGEAAEAEERRRAWLRVERRWDDRVRIEGELDPERGAIVKRALRAVMGPKASGDERSPGERTAAALAELCEHRLDAGDLPRRGGERPHLVVVADLATLRREPGSPLATLDWGVPITGKTACRMAAEADVTTVLVDEAREVLHVGRRKRRLTARQRVALNLRDGGCRTPGCDAPPDECQAHHDRRHADGGTTDLPNMGLRCDPHHARLHPENARFRRHPSRSP